MTIRKKEKTLDIITIQVYIIFIGRHLADKEVMSVGRKKKKPSTKKMRKVKNAGIAVLLWTVAAIAGQILEHYLPIVLGW